MFSEGSKNIGYIILVKTDNKEAKRGQGRKFAINSKVGDKWVKGKPFPAIEDFEVKKLGVEVNNNFEKPTPQIFFDIRFKDGKDYKLSMNFSNASRTLCNSLLSLKDMDISKGLVMSMNIYLKNGYDNFYVEVNGERLSWALDFNDPSIPESPMIYNPATQEDQRDNRALNNFWYNKIETEVMPLFATPRKQVYAASGDTQVEEKIIEDDTDDSGFPIDPPIDNTSHMPPAHAKEMTLVDEDDLPF